MAELLFWTLDFTRVPNKVATKCVSKREDLLSSGNLRTQSTDHISFNIPALKSNLS